tara:strand:+ start:4280 stop:5230 length:951 start_codon:yes stop_codon:yes gene_type:complete
MSHSLVSVIIPTYNSIEWIKESIDSVLNQTYKNYELIIIDDGSNDGTKDLIESTYKGELKYYWKANEGLSSARNYGNKLAKGSLIQYLDSDDLLPKDKLKNHVSFLNNNPDIDVVYSDCKIIKHKFSQTERDWGRRHLYKNGYIFDSMLEDPFILPHMCLSKKSFLNKVGDFDVELNSCIDYDFWLRAALCGGRFHFLDDGMSVYYRDRSDSISKSGVEYANNGIFVLNKIQKKIDISDHKKIQKLKADWVFKRGRSKLLLGNWLSAYFDMITSLIGSRKNLMYKVLVILFSFMSDPKLIDDRIKIFSKYIFYKKS